MFVMKHVIHIIALLVGRGTPLKSLNINVIHVIHMAATIIPSVRGMKRETWLSIKSEAVKHNMAMAEFLESTSSFE